VKDQRQRSPVDDALIGRLAIGPGDVVVELGCGRGFTLAAAAEEAPGLVLLGLDLDGESLADAQAQLDEAPGVGLVALADLAAALPVADASVSKVLCHNVLEQLPDPSALLSEASRVLRPGGRSVWSHADFESVIISGGDPELTRRVVHSYARTPDTGRQHSDGQLGRKLAGLVGASALQRVSVDAHVVLSTEMRGPAELRVKSMFSVLRDASAAGQVDLTGDELDGWLTSLRDAAARGAFLYAHTTFIVVAEKR
jgi:hypothetical protein